MRMEGSAVHWAALLLLVALAPAIPVATAQSQDVDIDVEGNAFKPSSVTVLVGTTVVWHQRDMIEHTVTVDDNQPEDWMEGILLPENAAGLLNTFEHTFENLGTTTYHCEVHPNMVGEVIVVESFDSPVINVNANDANEFSPERIEVNNTDQIRWLNPGTVAHTVTFEDEEIGDLGELGPDDEILLELTGFPAGSYRYRCTYHSGSDFETGMVGKVVLGGNATFPTVLIIDEPGNGTVANGTAEVKGRVVQGEGQQRVTDLEYAIDDDSNWTAINITTLDEFQWIFTLDTTKIPNGNHTLIVRALADAETLAEAEANFEVANSAPPVNGSGGIPGPSALILVGALAVGALVRRRTRLT